jgi:type 2 lantibiotic biosynthesis protein LanM
VLTLEDRSGIAHRAATLDERLAQSRRGPSGSREDGGSACVEPAALKTWQRAFSGSDRGAFLRRLAWDGLDLGSIAVALSEPGRGPGTPPFWTTWLQRFGQHATALGRELPTCGVPPEVAWLVAEPSASGSAGSQDRHGARKPEPPFIELWVPILRAMYAELRYSGRTLVSALPSPVRHGLQRIWLSDVAAAGQHAAWEAFQHYVPAHDDLVSERPPWHSSRASDRYDAFVSGQLRTGLAPLFRDYALLARDLALIAESGVAAALELLRRLEHDREAIGRRFLQGRGVGTLTDLRGSLSDPHGGRRRVIALTFSSGLRLIYKPRDVTLDGGFSEMVAWLSARGLSEPPPTANVLGRDRYGWMEMVQPDTCSSEAGVRKAYDAAGVLLCLTWLLGARDLHWQNVIATAAGPVLIDLETLLQPDGLGGATGRSPSASPDAAAAGDADACLASGLLSCLQPSGNGDAVDVGGLRGRADRLPAVPSVEWTDLRSDAIQKRTTSRPVARGMNLITRQGRVAEASSFEEAMLGGYRRAYASLLKHRDALVGADGLLVRWFGGGLARVVLRPSQRYGQALAALHEAAFLRHGIARGIALETLSRPFSGSRDRPSLWPIATEERRALTVLDVPRFSVRVDERCVREAREAGEVFTRSGLAAADARARSMSDEQLKAHEGAIATSLRASPASRYDIEPRNADAAAEAGQVDPDWVGAALWIAEALLRSPGRAGEISSVRSVADAIRAHGLYEGELGVALFLAALGRVQPDSRFEARVRSALRDAETCVAAIEISGDRIGASVGATSGMGSIALAAVFIAQVDAGSGAERLAERAATLLDLPAVNACAASDVVAGTAGAVLALLAVHELTGAATWIDRAVAAGDVLLERARVADDRWIWPSPDAHSPLGFAHGPSGIAYSLLQLASVTSQKRFEEAARGAIEYERPFYSPAQRSWPAHAEDASVAGLSAWMNAWCYGAAGISLTRTLAWRLTGDPSMEAEAGRALEAAASASASMADHLCCGNLGRAETLLTAAEWLDDRRLAARSRDIAADVLRRSVARGHVSLSSSGFTYQISRPGFFQGLAGVGYHWLRQAAGGALPAVLALEAVPRARLAGSMTAHAHAVD